MNEIPFQKKYISRNEFSYLEQYLSPELNPRGFDFREECLTLLQIITSSHQIHLTSSCTSSLDLAALLSDLKPNDEVIMPSFTFSSTANAVALRGAKPVFVDVKNDTLNIDENLIENALTHKTRAIIAVHYAGISCNMTSLLSLAKKYKLRIIEDAAQGLGATYKGKHLGTMGDFGAISFHHTKNIHCGEGGAIISKKKSDHRRASLAIEKGTNRDDFINGQVDKYKWVSLGSSFVLSNLQIAFLFGQLERTTYVTQTRSSVWYSYHEKLKELETAGCLTRPSIEPGASINGHIYYVRLASRFNRACVINSLKCEGINVLSHYEPLHCSPAGIKFGRISGKLDITKDASSKLIRLPIWPQISEEQINKVVNQLERVLLSDQHA